MAEQHIENLERVAATPPALTAEETEAALGLTRARRRLVQRGLAALEFDVGVADGIFGPRTRAGIARWQIAQDASATGYLDATAAAALLEAVPPPTTLLQPKCAELPGQYLGENHAQCWEVVENRPGCFLWRTHYHSDQTTRWTGDCKEGIAEGLGVYSVSAGSEHSAYEGTGTLVNGKANGRWIDQWADGDRYEGEYRRGERHGRGVETWKGTGEYAGREGRFEGQWRNGKKHGHGTQIRPDGGRYEGDWRNGKEDGHGTQIRPDGGRYEGDWRNGKEDGHGTQILRDGNRYDGEYRAGKRHGFGTFTTAYGDRYMGQWRKGCFEEGRPCAVQTPWRNPGCFGPDCRVLSRHSGSRPRLSPLRGDLWSACG